ncbi:MAG: adenylate/guanylate cyclase domain-containing protein [Bdellovibrionales bacterium]
MKKKPIIFVALVGFWLGYVTISLSQYFYLMDSVVEADNQRRFRHIDYEMFLASGLLATGEVESLIENLDESSKTKEFDFYLLKDGKDLISFYNPGYSKDQTLAQEFAFGTWMSKDNKVGWRTIKVRDYTLTIGIQPRGSEYILRIASSSKWGLIPDIIIVTLFFGLLIYAVLKDILDLTKLLQLKDRTLARGVKARTKEAEVLRAVTSQYEQISHSLKLSNQTFADSLSPAVRYELAENTLAPHLFDAAVVRVDVNGYTQMFLEKKDEFVTTTLNTYFQKASEVIQRYQGHIYQYVGDEIVFHFKAVDHQDPVAVAVSCVRGLFEIAQDMDEELKPKGVPFVVKAAIVSGRMRFINLDTGYAFAGLPLIESVRMLGKIDERENNIVALYSEDFKGCTNLAEPFKKMTVAFKGFAKQSEIVEVKDFKKVEDFLDELRGHPHQFKNIGLWRSDRDLGALLKYLSHNLQTLKRDEFLEIYKCLKAFSIQRTTGQVTEEYIHLLAAANQHAAAMMLMTDSDKDAQIEMSGLILASVVALSSQVLRSGVLNEAVRHNLEKNLNHPDQRVRANTILALDELAPESYSFREIFSSPDNRAAADALMAQGKHEYSTEVHRFLRNFLKSDDPFFVASGLYVMSYLYDHHRRSDSVYFAANAELQEIPDLLQAVHQNPDPMVRRRLAVSEKIIHKAA